MKATYRWLFILAIVTGLVVELVKESADRFDPKAGGEAFSAAHIAEMSLRPYHNSDSEKPADIRKRNKRSFRKGKSKGSFKWPENHTFEHKNKGKRGKKVAKKGDKKKDKKKKDEKDKKNKSESKTEVAKTDKDLNKEDENAESPKDGTPGAEDFDYAGGLIEPTTEEEDTDLPIGYEEWAARILTSPSLTQVTKFVKYYQTNLVSPDVFYLVLDDMVEDDRLEMNELAIIAAGSTTSYQSFFALTKLMSKTRVGSPLYVKANKRLVEYENIQHVQALQPALRPPSEDNVDALELAVRTLQASTAKNLRPEDLVLSNDPNRPDYHPNIRYYQSLVPSLESIVEAYRSDSSISGPALEALERIKDFIS